MTPMHENALSTLYCGDSEKVLEELSSQGFRFDKVVTSPPYNIVRDQYDIRYDVYKDGMDNSEYVAWMVRMFRLFDAMMNENGCVLWNMSYGNENNEALPLTIAAIIEKTNFTMADILVWKKNSARPNNTSGNKSTRICEFVFVFCRRSEYMTFKTNKKAVSKRENGQDYFENVFNFFEAPNGESTEMNKSTFSKEFVDELLSRYVSKGDVVLDPFSGSGTTMVACEARGIRSMNVELSERQCEESWKRLNEPLQLKLL